jgi:hypothetical protein
MSDDWRLRADLHEGGHARRLTDRLEAGELEHDLESEFHDRVVVSRDGAEVFLYAGSREQAEATEKLIRSLAAGEGCELDSELRRWHEASETWEEVEKPVPDDDAARAAEHARLIAAERDHAAPHRHPRVRGPR